MTPETESEIETVSDQGKILRVAVFGKQVEYFLESDIGVYLLQCAHSEIDKYTEKLKVVNPTDWEKIVSYQMKVQIGELFIGWLGDAVRSGLQSTKQIQEDA